MLLRITTTCLYHILTNNVVVICLFETAFHLRNVAKKKAIFARWSFSIILSSFGKTYGDTTVIENELSGEKKITI